MLSRSASRSQPLPEKISLLLQEAKWLALGVLSLYIGLILLGYSKTDPGWSHAAEVARVSNPGGRFGAWLADLLFYLFGLSAWWWVIFLGYGLAWGFRRLRHAYQADRRSFFIVLAGFFVVLLSSSALESLRFHTHGAALPLAPGGLVGVELGAAVQRYLGFTGGTLMLLALLASGLSLFSGISWFTVIERVGLGLEQAWLAAQHAYYTWQDRRAGRELAQKREAVVETKRRKTVEAPPPQLRIEPAVVEVPKSERVQKERQQTLFADHAEGGLPPLALLDEPAGNGEPPSAESLAFTSRLIESKLGEFGVEVKVLAAYPGPVITRYEIEPATGVKGSQVVNLAKDLARALSLISIRVVETVPGKSCMALELPNPKRQTVRLSEIVGSKVFHDMHSPLTVVLGKDIGGLPVVADLAKMPHLLVAGTTGSGKSVGINAMILSLLYKSEPERVRLIMVDPKMLELSIYEGIPHLLAPVVTDMKHAANALNWCVVEMDKRYKLMAAVGVRNLAGFNKAVAEAAKAGAPLTNPFSITPESPEPIEQLPHIVVVVDELADLMMVAGKKIEELIARLAQKARAAGIHLILATQRPSVDVITGLIKANVPTRIAFQVSSKIDSRTILDQMGAEALLGMGDMLYLPPGTGLPVRVHGAFVADEEVHKVVEHLKKMGPPDYVEGILSAPEDDMEAALGGGGGEGGDEADPLYDQAVEVVVKTRRPSISLVQRHLRIGYNRAARLIEQMERAGLVSAMGSNGNREVIVPPKEGD
ncbi:DNA translocase FtsK 4TM domain-containing protein [Thauera sp. CAU 1555]|uniref:DNA translocase FtsK 4TM domain-containing protein n=1 Tax=Thauera sedimentorum TaxID=2767595 RepID=A0ABR9B6M2_9RHOO|nr:DNA translocase FtsK [Thauera sedimentorum]MBC9070640.1 DNA translocase FtsK 4TM domain-containing protein [Thauera sedimentorum]MBD8501559.1 DNA translocase FtsK 4TM domain-containing protein [Thauera sedimentorum]